MVVIFNIIEPISKSQYGKTGPNDCSNSTLCIIHQIHYALLHSSVFNIPALKPFHALKFSNVYPTLYGLIPQTYCGDEIAEFCMKQASREEIVGDGDPLDICVLAEKSITHGDILLPVTPIGGLRMIDDNEADDKIIAVMRGDAIYGHMRDIHECPPAQIDRLKHYFLTYKDAPGARKREAEITHVYGREEALEVIERSQRDYADTFGDLKAMFDTLRTGE